MRMPLVGCEKWLVTVCLIALASSIQVAACRGNSFGINFQGGAYDQWGPYYLNQVGAFGAGPYASAFGVPAADWYEPGADIANTDELPGAPTSVPFSPASMGPGSVNIGFESNRGVDGNGFNINAYGFSHANSFLTVDDNPMDGQPDTVLAIDNPDPDPDQIWYVQGAVDPATNGVPISGEHAVRSGALWGTAAGEYGVDWEGHDIVVTISGLQSIASGYHVTLLAAAPDTVVEAFTPAQLSDSDANSDQIDFTVVDRASYWSPASYPGNPAVNPYLSPGGDAISAVTFTGDTLTIRLSGANEYTNGASEIARTLLSGVIIDYSPVPEPTTGCMLVLAAVAGMASRKRRTH